MGRGNNVLQKMLALMSKYILNQPKMAKSIKLDACHIAFPAQLPPHVYYYHNLGFRSGKVKENLFLGSFKRQENKTWIFDENIAKELTCDMDNCFVKNDTIFKKCDRCVDGIDLDYPGENVKCTRCEIKFSQYMKTVADVFCNYKRGGVYQQLCAGRKVNDRDAGVEENIKNSMLTYTVEVKRDGQWVKGIVLKPPARDDDKVTMRLWVNREVNHGDEVGKVIEVQQRKYSYYPLEWVKATIKEEIVDGEKEVTVCFDDLKPFQKGDRIEANYQGKGIWYPAKFAGKNDDADPKARCPLCNGKEDHPEARPREEPQPDEEDACSRCQNVRYVRWDYYVDISADTRRALERYFKKDDKVEAKYKNGRWYSATIKADNGDDTYRIEYDDGVVTTHQPVDCIRLCKGPLPVLKDQVRRVHTKFDFNKTRILSDDCEIPLKNTRVQCSAHCLNRYDAESNPGGCKIGRQDPSDGKARSDDTIGLKCICGEEWMQNKSQNLSVRCKDCATAWPKMHMSIKLIYCKKCGEPKGKSKGCEKSDECSSTNNCEGKKISNDQWTYYNGQPMYVCSDCKKKWVDGTHEWIDATQQESWRQPHLAWVKEGLGKVDRMADELHRTGIVSEATKRELDYWFEPRK